MGNKGGRITKSWGLGAPGTSWVITRDQSLYIFGEQNFGFPKLKYSEESGPIQKAPWKVKLPRSLKEEGWRKIFSWVFLGVGSKALVFSVIPVEVVFHMVRLLM
jgi:hypothetical protein